MKQGWRALPFTEVLVDESAGNLKTPQSEFKGAGAFPIVDQGKQLIAGYVNDKARLCNVQLPVIIFGDHTRCFKFIDFPFCMGADGVKVLRPRIEAEEKYLYHFLRHVHLVDAGYDRHFKHLKRIEVLLPPILEQRRIVAILDQAEALRAKRRAALAKLDTLAQSIFIEMFGDPHAPDSKWTTAKLSDLSRVVTGGTPSSTLEGMFDGSIPFVTPGDLESGAPVKRTLTEAGAAEVKVVRAGSTLVCCIGATIGKMGKAIKTSAFNQQINAVEWGAEIDDDFGLYVLTFYRTQIRIWGASTTLPILKKSAFEKIEIPVPPIKDQRVFSNRVKNIDFMKTAQIRSLECINDLCSTLQYRAFRGEL